MDTLDSNCKSEWQKIKCGVPQGRLLGPFIISVCMLTLAVTMFQLKPRSIVKSDFSRLMFDSVLAKISVSPLGACSSLCWLEYVEELGHLGGLCLCRGCGWLSHDIIYGESDSQVVSFSKIYQFMLFIVGFPIQLTLYVLFCHNW